MKKVFRLSNRKSNLLKLSTRKRSKHNYVDLLLKSSVEIRNPIILGTKKQKQIYIKQCIDEFDRENKYAYETFFAPK